MTKPPDLHKKKSAHSPAQDQAHKSTALVAHRDPAAINAHKDPAAPTAPATAQMLSSNEEAQIEEIEALRSIFMENFVEVEAKKAWSKTTARSFKLRLHAPSDPSVFVLLSVTFTVTYPKSIPNLLIEQSSTLTKESSDRVTQIISNRPKNLLGEAMMFGIADDIQEALELSVIAVTKSVNIPSLEEERALSTAAAITRAEQEKAIQAKLADEQKAEASRAWEQEIKQQKKKRDQPASRSQATTVELESVTFDNDIDIVEDGSHCMFRSVYLANLSHKTQVTTVYSAIPATNKQFSTRLVIKRAVIRSPRSGAMINFDQLLIKLKNETYHQNVMNVLAYKLKVEGDIWTFDILTETSESLKDCLTLVGTLPYDRAKTFGTELLGALAFIHAKELAHGTLNVWNVLLKSQKLQGTSMVSVKLVDAAFYDELFRLKSNEKAAASEEHKTAPPWSAPEYPGKKSRKVDIWDFGVVFAKMLFGLDVDENFPNPTGFLAAHNLSDSLRGFFEECFKVDAQDRSPADKLRGHEFLRSGDGIFADDKSAQKPRRVSFGANQVAPNLNSRYASDWDQLGRLGKGGYGEVVKARNKLDGIAFAIKIIKRKTPKELAPLLKESQILATFNNSNIVRYYTSWVEDDMDDHNDSSDDETDLSEDSGSQSENPSKAIMSASYDLHHSNGQMIIEFEEDEFNDAYGGVAASSESEEEDEEEDDNDDEDNGEDDDEEDDDETDDEADDDIDDKEQRVDKATASSVKTEYSPGNLEIVKSDLRDNSHFQHPEKLQTLYIQMEFCEKLTLRNKISNGVYDNVEDVWRLLLQVLEGLAYIHKAGVIHRDLKPENIFMDASENLRIGDFGLAKTGHFRTTYSSVTFDDNTVEGNTTRNAGTALYVAPECTTEVGGRLTEKIDMYSLGIILFEMSCPLSTGMERVEKINELRKNTHILPEMFETAEKALQKAIILSLVNHDPDQRPSSEDMLRNEKIPVPIEAKTVRLALEAIEDDQSPHHHQILSALFSNRNNSKVKAHLWHNMGKAPIQTASFGERSLLISATKERMTACFRRHGAVEVQSSNLIPLSTYYENQSNVFKMLTSSGTMVQLPFDLTLPYVSDLAEQSFVAEKTFAFGYVYRVDPMGDAPKAIGEAVFNIVSRRATDRILQEAEIIKVMETLLDNIPSLRSAPTCFHVSHDNLVNIILDFCRIPPAQWFLVKGYLGTLNTHQQDWQKVQSELGSRTIGVSSASLNELARFNFRDTPEKCLTTLQKYLSGTKFVEQLNPIFTHFVQLLDMCKHFGVRHKILISPLSSCNDKFYKNNIMIQCLFDSKKRSLLAAGGRYDTLIEDLRPVLDETAKASAFHGVGINISWDAIVDSVEKYHRYVSKTASKRSEGIEDSGKWANRRCDVLVASFDLSVLHTTGVKILSNLWNNDISAELAAHNNSLEDLLAQYRADKHSWIVIIKHEGTMNDKPDIKLKSLEKNQDFDMHSSELLTFLRNEIRERDERENANERVKLQRHYSQQESSSTEKNANIQVLRATYKSKKASNWNLIASAQQAVQNLTKSLADGPVVCIETSDEVMEMIRTTKLSDSDSWKAVSQKVALSERKYIQQVFEMIQDFKTQHGETTRHCFVFNFKTGTCVCYDMMI